MAEEFISERLHPANFMRQAFYLRENKYRIFLGRAPSVVNDSFHAGVSRISGSRKVAADIYLKRGSR